MSGKDGTVVPGDEDAVAFVVEYAKSSRSKCKFGGCKRGETIDEKTVRLGTIVPNPFVNKPDATMTVWWHPECLFESQRRGRASKRKIKDESEIDGFDALKPKDQDNLRELIEEESETTEGPKEWTHLESIEGSHQKWWKIGINDDKTTTTKYGDIGKEGFSLAKVHSDRAGALKYMAEKIAEKRKVGYSEPGAGAGDEGGADGAEADAPVDDKAKPGKGGKGKAKTGGKSTDKDNAASTSVAEAKEEKPGGGAGGGNAPSSGAGGGGSAGESAEDALGFRAEYAKSSRSACKGCKNKIEDKSLRLAKLVQNPFVEHESVMPLWFHVECLFKNLKKGKQNKAKLTQVSTLEGWETLTSKDKAMLEELIATEASVSSALEHEVGIHLRATDGGNNKWWEISLMLHGAKRMTQTRWGDIALGFSEGNFVQKEFDGGDDDDELEQASQQAIAYRDKMVRDKLKKGYHFWSVDGVKTDPAERDAHKSAWLGGGANPPGYGGTPSAAKEATKPSKGGGGSDAPPAKKRKGAAAEAKEVDEEEDEMSTVPTKGTKGGRKRKAADEDDEEKAEAPPTKSAKAKGKGKAGADVSAAETKESELEPAPTTGATTSAASLGRDELQAMTMPQLKTLCQERGLSMAGKKADLVDRLAV